MIKAVDNLPRIIYRLGLDNLPNYGMMQAIMKQLVLTTNAVRLSFLQALLGDAGIEVHVFDQHVSAIQAGIGAFPCRLMVSDRQYLAAKTLLEDAQEFYDD